MNAFLVVDVQNDFISGSLNISNCSAQQNGIEVSAQSNTLLHRYGQIGCLFFPISCLLFQRFVLISGLHSDADDVLSFDHHLNP